MATTVAEVMTRTVVAARENAEFKEILAVMHRGRHLADEQKAAAVRARDLMTQPAVTVGPGALVAEAARVMRAHRVRRLPVTDEAGRLTGIVSRIDLLSVYDHARGAKISASDSFTPKG